MTPDDPAAGAASPAPQRFAPRDDGRAVEPRIVEQAAAWMACLQSGVATETDESACLRWRQAHPDHERAWQRMQGLSRDVRQSAAGIHPAFARATLRAATRSRRTLLKSAAGIAVAGLGAWAAREQAPWRTWAADHGTAVGERRRIALEDGTEIVLGTRTAIDVRFGAERREISLRTGEILVTTARDAQDRPMRVLTGSGSIDPVGTRFSVRFEPDAYPDLTRVAVLTGAVDIRPHRLGREAVAYRLDAGRQTRFTSFSVEPAAPADPAGTAWIDGMLVAERMRLADFVAELDRHRRGYLRCDPAVAELRVSGAFPLDRPEAVLGLLQETLPVRVRTWAGFWTTVGPR